MAKMNDLLETMKNEMSWTMSSEMIRKMTERFWVPGREILQTSKSDVYQRKTVSSAPQTIFSLGQYALSH